MRRAFHGLGADPCPRGGRGGAAPRRGPVLPQIPLSGRIRVRPRVGGGLSPRGRPLLPEAPGVGAVHTRQRPASPRGRHSARGRRAQAGASSIHTTFLTELDVQALAAEGFLARTDQQFHWFNEGYRSFEDFLAALSARKRKTLKRERRDALADGISIE